MDDGAREFPRRNVVLAGACIGGALLALGTWLTSCSLPSALCAPCNESCPGGLTCENQRCVRPDRDDDCSAPGATATTSGVMTSGSGTGGSGADGSGTGGSSGAAGSPPGSTTAATNGGADDCSVGRVHCAPQFKTPFVLPAVCSGGEIHVELAAGCACDDDDAYHSVAWAADDLPPGLTLTASGELFGSLPDGTHEFELTAVVDEASITNEFEITVLDRCLVFFASAESTTGVGELAAARIDTGERVPLGADAPQESTLVAFEASPNGRFLAEVSESADRRTLRLFGSGAVEVEPLPLEYSGDYVAHAFSRDSRWLAVVTAPTDPTEASEEQQLELVDLRTEPPLVVDVTNLDYEDGLTWSDGGGVLYRSTWTEDSLYLVAQERAVGSTGFGTEEPYLDTRTTKNLEFHQFLVSDEGFFMVYQGLVPYFDRKTHSVVLHPPVEALSPDLRWAAQLDSKGVWVTRAAAPSNLVTQRAGCDLVRAWAGNGSRLLCTLNHLPSVFQITGDGSLDRAAVLTGIHASMVSRIAFSDDGRWLALTPTDAGLVVLSEDEFATKPFEPPTLGLPSGKNEWDYFFTPNATRLVVQRGRKLLIAALDHKTSVTEEDFEELAVTLPELTDCELGWFPKPSAWCGAPRYRGNIRLSPAGRHIAFEDIEGVLYVAVLDAREAVPVGRLADLPLSDNVVFQ